MEGCQHVIDNQSYGLQKPVTGAKNGDLFHPRISENYTIFPITLRDKVRMRFFGSKDRGSAQGEPEAHASRDDEPDERTRLLPNRIDSNPRYLRPNDPAVSPYNLWSVRAIRSVTVLLTIVTFLWYLVTLISLFVTPPGLHLRGSHFFAFSYTSIALATLIVTLLFFAAPSKSARVLAATSALLLLVNTIIIAAVEKTRHEEAWVGIASVVCT